MTRRQSIRIGPLFGVALFVLCILAGCAGQKALWGDLDTGLILKYQMPEGRALSYRVLNDFGQKMEVMGHSMEITSLESRGFTFRQTGMVEGGYRLGVVMDSMSMKIVSPQGEINPDTDTVVGKSFEMVVSPLGEEIELIGADQIEFNAGPDGMRNISSGFQAFFPDLPGKPAKFGDTWPTSDTITEKTATGQVNITITGTSTLAGLETINGYECVKITTPFTGTIEGSGSQQGMDLTFTGTMEGTDTSYFAYKDGIFVRMRTEGTGDTTVKGTGVQEMTIPMTRVYSMEVDLLK